LKLLVIGSATGAIFVSFDYFKQESMYVFEYMILLVLSTCSMLLMISSYDFISMYLTIELQSLCFYVLAASKRNSEFSTEAGLKYFLLGAFSSGLLLFGFSLLYGFTGMIHFEDLARLFTGFGTMSHDLFLGILVGILFLAVGFLFKITAAPFHMWAPDVYEGAPTSVTAFFALAPKIAILGVFLRLFFLSFFDFFYSWQSIFLLCSLCSMIVGSLAAMSQKKMKRLLAFSSIGHIGYILLGFSCGTVEGLQAILLYLVIYVLMTLNIFSAILALKNQENNLRIKYISDLGLLGSTNPVLAFTMAMTLFSMAGIPPLAGFCSKFYIFFAALGSSLYVLAIVGVLTSCISCFYYIRIIKIMYFEQPTQWIVFQQVDQQKALMLASTLFFILFFFAYPSPLFLLSHKAALALCM
jgi:proton-translocating NADH-quinone oxidoreductase chain N